MSDTPLPPFPPDTMMDAPLNETGRSKSGRAGGNKTKMTRGSEFYREIGRKGGKARGRNSK
jgi:general stress protein YciG